jgi:hypothetical protein
VCVMGKYQGHVASTEVAAILPEPRSSRGRIKVREAAVRCSRSVDVVGKGAAG